VIWTQTERKKGQAWGLKTTDTFHTHGIPPVNKDQIMAILTLHPRRNDSPAHLPAQMIPRRFTRDVSLNSASTGGAA
jgi:hypothetical protein